MEASAEARKRPRLRLSLRTTMLLILVLAAWMGWKVNRAHTQRRAVAVLRRAGSGIYYDDKPPGRRANPGVRHRVLSSLRRLLGEEFFQEATSVMLEGRRGTDEVLAAAGRLDRLESLFIRYDFMEPGTRLSHLSGLSRLKALWLVGPGLDDAAMTRFPRLPALVSLDLDMATFGDAGLARLAGLPKLERLWLGGTAITDAGLVHLMGLSNLTSLDLSGTSITDAGLDHLAGLSRLRSLDLDGTKVSPQGIARLKAMRPSLRVHQ